MNIYQRNIQTYKTTILQLLNVSNTLSAIRLIAFAASVIIIIVLANERCLTLMLITVAFSIIGFSFLIKRHNQLDYLKQYTTFLKEINEYEVLKLENRLAHFPRGETFIDRDHPYSADLDIFGKHSLFQLINRTTTDSGYSKLAAWLSAPAAKNVIIERQGAVKELTPKLAWRQNFQASGMYFKHTNSDYVNLIDWIEKPVQLLSRRLKFLIFIIPLSILSTCTAVYFVIEFLFLGNLQGVVPLTISFLINAIVLTRLKPIAEDILKNIHNNIKILHAFQSLIVRIESEKFHSNILQQLQSVLRHNDDSAASEIRKLKSILEIFQLRGSKIQFSHFFYTIFNNLWFLDFYLIILTEKWKYKNGHLLKEWVSAVGEFEVLSSVAGFNYSNPSYVFPEIAEEPYHIHFEMLGHPLISSGQRVCNHFGLRDRGEIAMITGSNMAGKSTFLRTVGINLVLALMGAPCCAKAGRVSNIQLFSSMRTQDSLEEGVSSFYAELKRVEQLLKLIESGKDIFFLLDEMFKGTNSKDRHKGGFSFIKQLQELNAFGMISTHDLELASLTDKNGIATNYCFNSEIQNDEIIFNYRLTDGLCKDFNASEMMKKSGIKIIPQF